MSDSRADAFERQGYQDFMKGRPFRWAEWTKHPYLPQYKKGWDTAKEEFMRSLPPDFRKAVNKAMRKPWWKRLLAWAGFNV